MFRPVKFAVILPTMLILMACVVTASAQRRNRLYTKAEVDRIIHNAENRSDDFVGTFDHALNRSRLNGSDREDQLNRRAKDLERAFDDLRREFDRHESYLETRNEASRCINIATDINVALRNNRFNERTERSWAVLWNEMDTLAQVYGLPFVGSRRY
jgi:biopolymer transport protein ExbB/TolQ